MIHYLDTSAALRLLIEEPESDAMARHLGRAVRAGDDLVASMLLFTELHCAAGRRTAIDGDAVNAVLDAVSLVDLDRGDLLRAATSSWRLRSADAIHLAVALRLEVDTLVTYDLELAQAARHAGLMVETPRPRSRS